MVLAAHAEDDVVAGEGDLDHDRPCAHVREQARRVAFEGEAYAMADAPRAANLDRLADVKREVGGRNEAEPELTRVQRDRHSCPQRKRMICILGGYVAACHQVLRPRRD